MSTNQIETVATKEAKSTPINETSADTMQNHAISTAEETMATILKESVATLNQALKHNHSSTDMLSSISKQTQLDLASLEVLPGITWKTFNTTNNDNPAEQYQDQSRNALKRFTQDVSLQGIQHNELKEDKEHKETHSPQPDQLMNTILNHLEKTRD